MCGSLLNDRFRTPSPEEYDYTQTTQQNYTQDTPSWIGPYKNVRETLDHSYHGYYTPERQRIQDDIMQDVINGGIPKDQPWIVFTAGAMGAGKGYTIRWMSQSGYFPLPDLVQIDPDHFKMAFPEWPGCVRDCRMTAGAMTRRESGYLVEIAQHIALNSHKNVWVDGSLRDYDWYSKVFDMLREKWPMYRIAILYVYADKEVVMARAKMRAEDTGREVPTTELLDSIEKVPLSVNFLSPKADFTAYISNNPSSAEPRLVKTEVFGRLHTIAHATKESCWKQISDRFATAKSLVARNSSQMLQESLRQRLQAEIESHNVVLFSKSYCSFSAKVKAVLAELDVQPVHCLELDTLPEGEGLALQLELSVLTKADGVPQVFVRNKYIGGCDTICKMQAAGTLVPLLRGDSVK